MKVQNKIFYFILGGLIFSCISVYAATNYLLESKEASYDNTDSGLLADNVQDAIDELYETMAKSETVTLDVSTISTTNSITVVSNVTSDSGIALYEYSINDSDNIESTDNNYTFTDLTQNTIYSIKIRVTTENGNVVETIKSATTKEMSLPTFTENTTSNGVDVTINYQEGCGDNYTCYYQKDSEDWVEVIGNPTISFTESGSITAKVTDNGDNPNEVSAGYSVEISFNPNFWADSWSTIIKNLKSGNTSAYKVGDTKCIALDGFTTTNDNGCDNGEFLVRVANKSEDTSLASQTASGFVIEFVDIITTYNMNTSSTNVGGWPATAMRTYVNGTIYNALPTDLKAGIMDTTVVSGHGSTSGESNFTSTDKLYLLAPKEVWNYENSYDSAYSTTKQLDYYYSKGVTTSNYSGTFKYKNGSVAYWWLHSAYSNGNSYFFTVGDGGDGTYDIFIANSSLGVAPAFRLSTSTSNNNTSNTTTSISAPTYTETETDSEKNVTINYPDGCGDTYTCSYKKDSGEWPTITSNPTISFTENGTYDLIAKVTSDSSVATSSYTVEVIKPVSFVDDSWDTIIKAVKAGNTSAYNVGDTKCVTLSGFTTSNGNCSSTNQFLVRVANNSTPDECSTDGFSQTACGFVIEFGSLSSSVGDV